MIVQAGGPTAVLNASLASALAAAIELPARGRIYGACHGLKGLAAGRVVRLDELTAGQLRLMQVSPGAALGATRAKPGDKDFARIVDLLRALDVGRMLMMGGNGTMQCAAETAERCRAAGLDVQVIGVPKTADNDLAGTDRCPGYASAARYIAQSTRDLGQDLRALPQPVTILETIGRSIGWPAAASVLAREREDDAPHIVCLPEIPFVLDRFLDDVDRVVTRQGWLVAVVTEGIRHADGSLVYELPDVTQADPLLRPMTGGVGQFLAGQVAQRLRIRCRSEKPGLLARSSAALAAPQDRLDAALVGKAGVQALVRGETGKMVSLTPLAERREPGWELVPFSQISGVERRIPASWLTEGPLAVGEEFVNYLQPLVGELQPYLPALEPAGLEAGVN
jgi:6-phosphofructokinase 1